MKAFLPHLLVAIICAGCRTPPQSTSPPVALGFPIVPPISDADPSVRHPVTIGVPTKLTVERTPDTLSITVDRSSLEAAEITVGSRMVTGVRSQSFVYPLGESRRPHAIGSGLHGGVDFNLGTDFVHTKRGGIPAPGAKYVVEMDLAVFETDVPPQHFWSPESENYRVLLKRTLRQIVE